MAQQDERAIETERPTPLLPYATPQVITRPLFERMALVCVDSDGEPDPEAPS